MMKYTKGLVTNGKKHPNYEKGMGNNFPDFLHFLDLLHFPMLCEIDEEANPFPMWGSIQ